MANQVDAQGKLNAAQFNSYKIDEVTTAVVVKSGPGFFHGVTIGTGSTGTITFYDNTAASGTVIVAFKASMPEGFYSVDCKFTTGLTVIVSSAAGEVTVSYH